MLTSEQMMSGDHFENFRRGLSQAKADAPPTRESRIAECEEHFEQIVEMVRKLGDMLGEDQPASTISYSFGQYDEMDDQLQFAIQGSKGSGARNRLLFIFQGKRLYAHDEHFRRTLGHRRPVWSKDEQDDLEQRVTNYFAEFFGTP